MFHCTLGRYKEIHQWDFPNPKQNWAICEDGSVQKTLLHSYWMHMGGQKYWGTQFAKTKGNKAKYKPKLWWFLDVPTNWIIQFISMPIILFFLYFILCVWADMTIRQGIILCPLHRSILHTVSLEVMAKFQWLDEKHRKKPPTKQRVMPWREKTLFMTTHSDQWALKHW